MTRPAFAMILLVTSACPTADSDDDAGETKLARGERCTQHDECASGRCNFEFGCAGDGCAGGCPFEEVCADHGTYSTCERPGERGDACLSHDVVSGTLELDRDCASGLVCVEIVNAFRADGVCVPPSARRLHEPCRSNNECEASLACSALTSSCGRLAGAPCVNVRDCATDACSPTRGCTDNECAVAFTPCELQPGQPGLFCGGGDCGLVCMAPVGEGEPCRIDDGVCIVHVPCDTNLECRSTTCVP